MQGHFSHILDLRVTWNIRSSLNCFRFFLFVGFFVVVVFIYFSFIGFFFTF